MRKKRNRMLLLTAGMAIALRGSRGKMPIFNSSAITTTERPWDKKTHKNIQKRHNAMFNQRMRNCRKR